MTEAPHPSSELSRPIKIRALPAEPITIEADATERAGLTSRFAIAGVERLAAQLTLEQRAKGIEAKGTLDASITQFCAVSGEEFPVTISEPLDLIFIEEAKLAQFGQESVNDEGAIEVDLFADDADEVGYTGDVIDLGEAVAQSLGLAIDPYAEGPKAAEAREKAGLSDAGTPSGPLAEALAALKKD